MKFPHVYKMLKAAGHDPLKSATIILDAMRGDGHSRKWIGVLFSQRRP